MEVSIFVCHRTNRTCRVLRLHESLVIPLICGGFNVKLFPCFGRGRERLQQQDVLRKNRMNSPTIQKR
jgi:hypothetical protein